MTQDEIMEMAREAGFERSGSINNDWVCYFEDIKAFANLVAAKATEEANARANASWTLMCKKMVAFEREALAQTKQDEDTIIIQYHEATIKRLEKRIEELLAQEQEPVAWMWDVNNGAGYSSRGVGLHQTDIPFAKHTPLYTTPPQRTWVGLTDEEIGTIAYNVNPIDGIRQFSRAIEAKLKRKNGFAEENT